MLHTSGWFYVCLIIWFDGIDTRFNQDVLSNFAHSNRIFSISVLSLLLIVLTLGFRPPFLNFAVVYSHWMKGRFKDARQSKLDLLGSQLRSKVTQVQAILLSKLFYN